jgi:hypothetical protein
MAGRPLGNGERGIESGCERFAVLPGEDVLPSRCVRSVRSGAVRQLVRSPLTMPIAVLGAAFACPFAALGAPGAVAFVPFAVLGAAFACPFAALGAPDAVAFVPFAVLRPPAAILGAPTAVLGSRAAVTFAFQFLHRASPPSLVRYPGPYPVPCVSEKGSMKSGRKESGFARPAPGPLLEGMSCWTVVPRGSP